MDNKILTIEDIKMIVDKVARAYIKEKNETDRIDD